MSYSTELIQQCRDLQVQLIPVGNKLKMRGHRPLPDDLRAALIAEKYEVIRELRGQSDREAECWLQEEWIKISKPVWHRIRKESLQVNDLDRAKYARWMLTEVLQDSDYKEIEQ